MNEVFSLEDVFNVMIELESMGSVHYSNMKNMTDNSKLIVLFDKLSKQELAHKELYTRFKTEIITFSGWPLFQPILFISHLFVHNRRRPKLIVVYICYSISHLILLVAHRKVLYFPFSSSSILLS